MAAPAPPPPKAPSTGDPSETKAPSAEVPNYECGWSEEHGKAWRRLVGPKPSQKGPVEFSEPPKVDRKADRDAPIVCRFADGWTYKVNHITMAPLLLFGGWCGEGSVIQPWLQLYRGVTYEPFS